MSVNTAVMETDEKLVLAPTNQVARNEVGTELSDDEMEVATNVRELKGVMEPNVKEAGGHYKEDRNNTRATEARATEARAEVEM